TIALPEGYISRLIGVDYTSDEVIGSLELIGATVEATSDGARVTVPSWRPDLTDSATLAEEVARIVGYDRIPSVLPVAPAGRGLSRSQRIRRTVADTLAAAGSTEILAFPFLGSAENNVYGSADSDEVAAIKVANALDATAPYLRTTLIP